MIVVQPVPLLLILVHFSLLIPGNSARQCVLPLPRTLYHSRYAVNLVRGSTVLSWCFDRQDLGRAPHSSGKTRLHMLSFVDTVNPPRNLGRLFEGCMNKNMERSRVGR